ncbi:MAG TPA: hypothetical protein VGK54_13140, partial [Chloroflexota bacterium]
MGLRLPKAAEGKRGDNAKEEEYVRLRSDARWLAGRLPFFSRHVVVGLLPLLVACGGPAPSAAPSANVAANGPTGPKRVVAAVVGEHPQIISK